MYDPDEFSSLFYDDNFGKCYDKNAIGLFSVQETKFSDIFPENFEQIPEAKGEPKFIEVIEANSKQHSNKKRSAFFSVEQKSYLNDWFDNHPSTPFPAKSEYEDLQSQTGLTQKQIRVYITNKRSRTKLKVEKTDE